MGYIGTNFPEGHRIALHPSILALNLQADQPPNIIFHSRPVTNQLAQGVSLDGLPGELLDRCPEELPVLHAVVGVHLQDLGADEPAHEQALDVHHAHVPGQRGGGELEGNYPTWEGVEVVVQAHQVVAILPGLLVIYAAEQGVVQDAVLPELYALEGRTQGPYDDA